MSSESEIQRYIGLFALFIAGIVGVGALSFVFVSTLAAVGVFAAGFLLLSSGVVREMKNLRELEENVEEFNDGNRFVSFTEKGVVGGVAGKGFSDIQKETRDSENKLHSLEAEFGEAVSELSKVMSYVTDGELNRRVEFDSESEETKQLEKDFNGMVAEMEETLLKAKALSQTTMENAETINSSIEEVADASRQVSEATQEISDGAVRQQDDIDETAAILSELLSQVEVVTEATDELVQRSEKTASESAEGKEAAGQAAYALEDIQGNVTEVSEIVVGLDEQVQEIEQLIEVIRDVTEKTNMLAINAGIEASRAGEAGDGFGVVAEEVKSLAEETDEKTDEIEESVSEIRKKTKNAIDKIETAEEGVEDSVDTVDDALKSLEEIAAGVEQMDDAVEEINTAVTEQTDQTKKAVNRADTVASIAEETAKQTQEVASAAEEQTAGMERIEGGVNDISVQAESLYERLDQFTVEESVEEEAERISVEGVESITDGDVEEVREKVSDDKLDAWDQISENET